MLYFVCRTYQRFTKAGVCTCHSIKEKTVTDAVIDKVREVCQAYLNPDELLPMALEAVENARKQNNLEAELQAVQAKSTALQPTWTGCIRTGLTDCCRRRIFSGSSIG